MLTKGYNRREGRNPIALIVPLAYKVNRVAARAIMPDRYEY